MASLPSVDAAEKGLAEWRATRLVSIVLPQPISRSSSTSSLDSIDSVDSFATYVTAATRLPSSARNSRIAGSRPVSKVSRKSVFSVANRPKSLRPKSLRPKSLRPKSLLRPQNAKPASRWTRFRLWFNTYRYVMSQHLLQQRLSVRRAAGNSSCLL